MTIKTSPYKVMLTNTSGLTTYDSKNHPVDSQPVVDQGVTIPRRCTINVAEAYRIIADAKAFNAKIAAEATAIRNS